MYIIYYVCVVVYIYVCCIFIIYINIKYILCAYYYLIYLSFREWEDNYIIYGYLSMYRIYEEWWWYVFFFFFFSRTRRRRREEISFNKFHLDDLTFFQSNSVVGRVFFLVGAAEWEKTIWIDQQKNKWQSSMLLYNIYKTTVRYTVMGK